MRVQYYSAIETNNVASMATLAVDSASTVADNLCEISWSNFKTKIVFVPYGHERFLLLS